ncbi:MAG: HNH endonuclease [Nanoarchaeota archaeon]
MVFTEAVKLEVKTKAHYKCCICNSFGFVEVHHIIPQAQDGSDDLDNAAPLCTKCHDDFGGNSDKRRWIREKRDFWYNFCHERLFNEDVNELRRVADTMEKLQNENNLRIVSMQSDINFLKTAVVRISENNTSLAQSLVSASPTETPLILSHLLSGSLAVSGASILMGKIEENN